MAKSIIKEKSYKFALEVIALSSVLKEGKNFVLSNQLLKSRTSIGANVEEALAGQSKKDFCAKMAIASKEARETKYWLRLLKDAKIVNDRKIQELILDSEELIKILTSIVKTGFKNNSKLKTQN